MSAACFKHKDQLSYEQFIRDVGDCKDGVVRVSLGIASTFNDVFQFVAFARSSPTGTRPRTSARCSRAGPAVTLVSANGGCA